MKTINILLRTGLPRQPLKLMLLAGGAPSVATTALVLIALSLGIENRGAGGHNWLLAALLLNAPGALVFTGCCALIILATGKLDEIPDFDFTIISACISTMIYAFAGLWWGVALHNRKTKRNGNHRA